ncbi:ATP-binding protein [Clostridium sardiniense]|uniref:ATP-binding protein n=1 Tax=Clostridium sardiniense TaxID=29369 RepID=A0ABS7L1U9_CLOSR|nr:ATP-binding protein [Clostridium sardiniense]MBY0757056.1 ATP-binding protein [Clostridium sardiniense]MDQ0462067.1 DNA replication protein DnaC [Clostridium sardiniense]
MIKGYQSELMEVYQKIRNEEDKRLKQRRAEIKSLYPEILDLDNDIHKLSLKLTMTILKKDTSEADIRKIKDDITDLRAKKCEQLVSHGYDPEYLNMHYRCKKCQDTGYIGIEKCNCYKDKLVKLYYKDSELQDLLRDNNFSNFNIELFSSSKENGEKYSPRTNMKNNLDFVMKDFIPNFKHGSDNLLFYGTPGSGKTFLSYCIAKELLDRGFLVVYKTSNELIRCLMDIKFNNNYYLEKLLLDCDLLIIDDLGSEQLNDFVATELFNLINRKLLKKKRMIISTNLTLSGIAKHYSERISSRLLGNFRLYKFYSDDIRIKLNLAKR